MNRPTNSDAEGALLEALRELLAALRQLLTVIEDC